MKRLFAIILLLVSSPAVADWTLIGSGTGFVVNKDYVLTAAHVLEDCDRASIRYKHKGIDTDMVAIDSTNDLGLLLVEKPFEQTAKLRSGKSIRLGDTVVNYGYPLFRELSDHAKISRGVINSLAGWGNDSRHIQYDAPTQPGNSGGPVLDLSGNVVGIVSSGLSQRYAEETGHIAQNVNFAVKSFVAEAFLSSNGVGFETAESIERMEAADIAEKAETFTVLVGCWEGFDESDQPSDGTTSTDSKTSSTPAVRSATGLDLVFRNDRLQIANDWDGEIEGDGCKGACLSAEPAVRRSDRLGIRAYDKSQCKPKSGDYLLAIDNNKVDNISPEAAATLLERRTGSTVTLHLRRHGWMQAPRIQTGSLRWVRATCSFRTELTIPISTK